MLPELPEMKTPPHCDTCYAPIDRGKPKCSCGVAGARRRGWRRQRIAEHAWYYRQMSTDQRGRPSER